MEDFFNILKKSKFVFQKSQKSHIDFQLFPHYPVRVAQMGDQLKKMKGTMMLASPDQSLLTTKMPRQRTPATFHPYSHMRNTQSNM